MVVLLTTSKYTFQADPAGGGYIVSGLETTPLCPHETRFKSELTSVITTKAYHNLRLVYTMLARAEVEIPVRNPPKGLLAM